MGFDTESVMIDAIRDHGKGKVDTKPLLGEKADRKCRSGWRGGLCCPQRHFLRCGI